MIDDLGSLPKTPAEAKRLGSKYYFTGIACRRGHVAERQTSNAVCVGCRDVTFKRFYDRNQRAMLKRATAAHATHSQSPDFRKRKSEVSGKWYREHPERHRENVRAAKARRRQYAAYIAGLEAGHDPEPDL